VSVPDGPSFAVAPYGRYHTLIVLAPPVMDTVYEHIDGGMMPESASQPAETATEPGVKDTGPLRERSESRRKSGPRRQTTTKALSSL